MAELSNRDERWRWAALVAALVLLDASLAFGNLWPTPAIRWTGALSVEFAFCVLAMALAHHWFGAPSRRALAWLGTVWVVLVVGRYADVTAPALYGRPINLFWDLRHVSAVVRQTARGRPRAVRRRYSRDGPRRGVGVRRVAYLRRQFVAGPYQPSIGLRDPRRRRERAADDAEARHARHHVRAPRLSRDRDDAGASAKLAGGRLLRIRRDLRRPAPRLQRAAVRVVDDSRSVCGSAPG